MKITKRIISILMVLTTLTTALFAGAVPAQAAKYTAFSQISEKKPMKTYILSTSNIPCYTNSSLKTRGTITSGKSSTAYIAPSDDVYVISVDKNLKWIKVTYPVGKKRYKAYIALSKITSNNSSHKSATANGKFMTYKRADTKTGSSTMYVSKGEKVYLIATKGSYYQILYPCSGGMRLAWVTKSNYNKYCSAHTHSYYTSYEAAHPHRVFKKCSCGYYYYTGQTKKLSNCSTCYPNNNKTAKFTYPMKNFHKNYTQWAVYPAYRKGSSRKYHVGVDFMSNTDKNIYAFTNGTVVACGTNTQNGKYVIISHKISGKTVYSFYAHMSSYNVSDNTSVKAGTKIGVVGATGKGANGYTHLHFSISDKLWSNGSYYGYISKYFTSNKVYDSESNMTYYNPYYVIQNGKLPS